MVNKYRPWDDSQPPENSEIMPFAAMWMDVEVTVTE